MTVIIGYINSNKNDIASALYSDNLELKNDNSISKVEDKIIKIDDRYIIGVVGLALVKIIINIWIKYFEEFQSSKKSFANIDQLMDCIEEGINKSITQWKIETIIDELYMNKYDQHESSLVILDKKNNKLYYAELGKILKGETKIELKQLEKGFLYEFGIPVRNNLLYNIQSFNGFNKEKIDYVIKEKLNDAHRNFNQEIGRLGCHFLKVNNDEAFHSAYLKPEDIIKNYFK